MRRAMISIVAVLQLALLAAADWPQFRGPNATGVSEETNLPVEFGADRNVVWKTAGSAGQFVSRDRRKQDFSHRIREGNTVDHRPGSSYRANPLAARSAQAAQAGNRASGERPGIRLTRHRRPECLRILPGFRSSRLRTRRQGTLAHASGTVQQSLRPWRFPDPVGRHPFHGLRSGCRLVPARHRQEERPGSVARRAAARPAWLRDASSLPAVRAENCR